MGTSWARALGAQRGGRVRTRRWACPWAWFRGYPVERRWLAESPGEEPVEVGPAAEPASAKAAGKLRSPGQCDGAGGGSQRAPGLDLRAGLGPGAVLSVRGGPTVEVSAARAGG